VRVPSPRVFVGFRFLPGVPAGNREKRRLHWAVLRLTAWARGPLDEVRGWLSAFLEARTCSCDERWESARSARRLTGMDDAAAPESRFEVPRIPASAGALVFDMAGRLLLLKPSYKKGWTIPGGQLEANGESPWEGCQRETREECGLVVVRGRLVCVDFRRPKPNRPGGVRFLFDCGRFSDQQLSAIRLQDGEIEEHRLAELPEVPSLLSGPLRRRVALGVGASHCIYLEDGRPVPGITS
jgi:8-oxo-dGTP diphosphatase